MRDNQQLVDVGIGDNRRRATGPLNRQRIDRGVTTQPKVRRRLHLT